MKVNGNTPYVNIKAYLQKVQNTKAPEVSQNGQESEEVKADNVILSPKAKEIYEAQKIAGNSSAIDVEKVAQIKQQIEEGTYQIDSNEIAKSLLKETLLDELV
jgi:negative regulator of flagellin synthesis FlgM